MHCRRYKKNTIKHISETEIHNTRGAQKQKAVNSMSPPPSSKMRPYQYFEWGESIHMGLYFPHLSSGGNPRSSPEETSAPASISLFLILLTWGRSLARPFPQCATESMSMHSRCVSTCARVCTLQERWLYTDTWRVGGWKMHACLSVCVSKSVFTRKAPCNCTYMSLPLSVCACEGFPMLSQWFFCHSPPPPHWMRIDR